MGLSSVLFWYCFFGIASAGMSPGRPDFAFLARKQRRAVRFAEPVRHDGIPDDPVWQTAPAATDFVEYSPENGAFPVFDSDVRFGFDDYALYICAVMYDTHPDSICRELGRRDQIEALNTDYISFDILPYNDALNMFEFKVSPGNLQSDTRYSPVGTDPYWDGVWESAVTITDSGWVAEVRIPYSALRFPDVADQVWGINMWRHIRRYNQWSTWCFVDNSVRELFNYYGELVGINHIDPPVRLSLSPYITGYLEKSPESAGWSYFLRGGMDLKFGISDSYTLDMMVIPDFGQVQSDDVILNLTPFEIRYDEKRQFFTEGTDMFDKCGIFYSRRVGATPGNYSAPYESLREGEVVTANPDVTRIINATKISGRNARGLGFGFFNAMSTNTWATVVDTSSGLSRRVSTQPFTNYNVLVADQNFRNNSYLTLINTNYWIPQDSYIANVTGLEGRVGNKPNTFQVFRRLNIIQQYLANYSPSIGYRYEASVARPSGRFQFVLCRGSMNNTYKPNDMGFLTNNNQDKNYLTLSWNVFTPVWKINRNQSTLFIYYSTLNQPYSFQELRFELNNFTQFRSFWSVYLEGGIEPLGTNNFYEPRVWGYVFKSPLSYDFTWNMGTDIRKPVRLSSTLTLANSPDFRNFRYMIGLTPRFRFSDRFNLIFTIQYEKNMNDRGWVETVVDSAGVPVIYFGRRDVMTLNNILDTRYIINTKLSVSLRLRHYWSQVSYLDYCTLDPDGSLRPDNYWQNHNINFNAFSADLQVIWYFAPGSELSLVWKNDITTQQAELVKYYPDDLSNTLSSPQTNSISLRILYYLDYLNVRKLFQGRQRKPDNKADLTV